MQRVLSVVAVAAVLAMAVGGPAAASAVTASDVGALPVPSSTQIVSGSPSGAAGDSESVSPSISSDGRYVVFVSRATNLGEFRSNGFHDQIYLRDAVAGTTSMISVSGAGEGNGNSSSPSISADGSAVAFVTNSTNLTAGVPTGIAQAVVWSRATADFTIVSVSNDPLPAPANSPILSLSLSSDGGSVAFVTRAFNLTADNTADVAQVFTRDLTTNVTSMVSVIAASSSGGGESDSTNPTISADGRIVTFVSAARLLGASTGGFAQVYARDTALGLTRLVTQSRGSSSPADASSWSATISDDGRFVAFCSAATNLTEFTVDGVTARNAYVRDLQLGSTRLVSRDVSGTKASDGWCSATDISSDGSAMAFTSGGSDLVAGEPHSFGYTQAFTADISSGRVALLSVSISGDFGNGRSAEVALSGDGHRAALVSTATDLVAGVFSTDSQIYLRDSRVAPHVQRIGGADRFEVSAKVSTDSFGPRSPVVYVASGAAFADALSGSAAAGAGRGPVLLVSKGSIPPSADAALKRLRPLRVVVLGGVNSVAASVEQALAAYSPAVSRIGGADRFDVSAALSAATFAGGGATGPVAYVASGEVFPDALSGSAAAGRLGGPVLLVQKSGVPAAVQSELRRLEPSRIVVLGGAATVPDSVVAILGQFGSTTRVAGADRFAVSAAVSASVFPDGARTVYVASGAVFPDALSGSAAAIQNGGPILLITRDDIPGAVDAELQRLDPTRIVVLGGTDTVAEATLDRLEQYLAPGV
jgi:putative cell wall-binding protein/Tol biopolymer transport system component